MNVPCSEIEVGRVYREMEYNAGLFEDIRTAARETDRNLVVFNSFEYDILAQSALSRYRREQGDTYIAKKDVPPSFGHPLDSLTATSVKIRKAFSLEGRQMNALTICLAADERIAEEENAFIDGVGLPWHPKPVQQIIIGRAIGPVNRKRVTEELTPIVSGNIRLLKGIVRDVHGRRRNY